MDHRTKHITIYDVARALGVSATTVSRALKDHYSIGKSTIRKVKKKAAEMGYEPNAIASSLRKKKTNAIGVIVSHINRPFISSLISGIEAVCSRYGYNVIITQSLDSYKKEREDVKTMFNSRVDGLIVSLAAETDRYEHFDPFIKNNYPLVFADRVSFEIDTDKVLVDNFDAAYMATNHLIGQGYRRIGHLAGVQQRHMYQKRLEGYLTALRDHRMPVDENVIHYSKLSYEDGINGAETLLNRDLRPDAIFASNDTSAIGFMQYAEECGYSIPDEIGVVGFNNDPVSSIIRPQLTTIDHPAVEIGKKAAEIVLDKVSGKSQTQIPQTISFKTKLLIRNSSVKGSPRGGSNAS
ncbi:MAG: LacI family transcriptional regulator [Cytophagales bacterium]|nr:LacI family transcriptional regulator [Cytophagales bacterium]